MKSDLLLSIAVERHVQRVLWLCGGNRSEAARRLGIDRRSLQRWVKKPASTSNRPLTRPVRPH